MQKERYGTRDLSYSAWHRADSLKRFIGLEAAQLASMVDCDAVLFLEHRPSDREPLCLIEAALDVGQDYKPATAITRLARRANLPAFVLLYKPAQHLNPADPRFNDLAGFRVKRLFPRMERSWREVSPGEWAQALLQIRSWQARKVELLPANDPYWNDARPRP